jgi:Protein of unknown function (DUF1493)
MEPKLAFDALEERAFAFVSIQSHVDRKKLSPMMRLAQDLDITGDDASHFFDAFGREFHVNLDELNMHWDLHFHPEAGWILNAVFVVIGCLTLAGSLLALFGLGGRLWSYDYFSPYRMYRTPTWVGSGIASLVCWAVAWYRNRDTVPITIADLIDEAEAGRWVKPYRKAASR